MNNKTVDALCREAMAENTLIYGDLSRFIVRLDGKYVLASGALNHDPLVRTTNGTYFIKYLPPGAVGSYGNRKFVVGQDLLGFKLRVAGSDHFERLREYMPEVEWMFRNTNYRRDLFRVAKDHPGMIVSFSVNWGKYESSIIEQMQKDHIDMELNKPLVTFKCAETLSPIHFKDKELSPSYETIGRYMKTVINTVKEDEGKKL